MKAPLAAAALLVLAGCSAINGSSDETAATPRSIAAVVIQYLPMTPTKAYDAKLKDQVAATIEFGEDEPPDSIQIGIQVDEEVADTRRKICVNCDVTEPDEDTVLQISRGDRLPGGGLGRTDYVLISRIRGDEVVTLIYQGTPIRVSGTASGNRLDVEKLIQMVQDPGMGSTTISGFVEDGEKLSFWTDGP